MTGSAGLPGTGETAVSLAQIVAALSVTYTDAGVSMWLRCPQCGKRYVDTGGCGPTHAIIAAEIRRAPYLLALVVREREDLDQLAKRADEYKDRVRKWRSKAEVAEAALNRVVALCDQNDGGLQQAHLVQLVEYIRAAAASTTTEGDDR